jgi:hypothetical protein
MRVLELAKLGFEQVVIPSAAPNLGLSEADLGGMRVIRQPTLRKALEFCFGATNLQSAARLGVERKVVQQLPGAAAGGAGGGSNGSNGNNGSRSRRSSRRTAAGSSTSST